MLEDSQDSVSDFSTDNSLVGDDEIKSMIYGNGSSAGAVASSSDSSLDDELEALKKLI
jgi:hypothetical protein